MRHILQIWTYIQGYFFWTPTVKNGIKKIDTEKNYEAVETKSVKLWASAKSDRQAIGRDWRGT